MPSSDKMLKSDKGLFLTFRTKSSMIQMFFYNKGEYVSGWV